MDNGYSKWKENTNILKRKKLKLFFKIEIIVFLVSLFVFLFGYDESMFDEKKILEFTGGLLGLTFLNFLIICIKYKSKKYIPLCNKCGLEIKNKEKDCVKFYEFVGTVDRTVYEKSSSTVKGKTTYDRGVYAMKNDTLEKTSTSTFEINQNIPVVKKFYVYNVLYKCKNCGEIFCIEEEESIQPKVLK